MGGVVRTTVAAIAVVACCAAVAGCVDTNALIGNPDLTPPPDMAMPVFPPGPDMAGPCFNGAKDNDETDVDCGGSCQPCGTGLGCIKGTDCQSTFCTNKTCAGPSCSDHVKNGDESDVDCGGSCPGCDNGKACGDGADCKSMTCTNGVCAASPCANGVKDGMETDVDCGGGTCAKCANGKMCTDGMDCVGAICTNQVCQAPVGCKDGIKNGSETDVDCGGNSCPKCQAGRHCTVNADCGGNMCLAGLCADQSVGCADGVREAFLNIAKFPTLAGCALTVTNKSLRSQRTGQPCGNSIGNCMVPEDACSPGWHLCMRSGWPGDLADRVSSTDCAGMASGAGKWSTAASLTSDMSIQNPACGNPLPCKQVGDIYYNTIGCGLGSQLNGGGDNCVWQGATLSTGASCNGFTSAGDLGVLCCRDPEVIGH